MSIRFTYIFALAAIFCAVFPAVSQARALEQVAVVQWKGAKYANNGQAVFVAPGIGTGKLVCRRNATWIEFTPYNKRMETTMWSSKYEHKGKQYSSAVKNARVYTYSHALDTDGPGTGRTTREGFNQRGGYKGGVEDSSFGYIHGVISQRDARNQSTWDTQAPTTSFYLTWNWSGYDGDIKHSQCEVRARLVTENAGAQKGSFKWNRKATKIGNKYRWIGTLGTYTERNVSSFNLNWHGEDDMKGDRVLNVPGFGDFTLSCDRANSTLSLTPQSASSGMYVTSVEGEGYDATSSQQYLFDPVISMISPVSLPVNGMFRIGVQVENRKADLYLTSWRKLNDPDPRKNFCEVSSQIVVK